MPTKTNRLQRIDGAYHFDFRPTSDYRQAQTSPGQRKIAKVADFLSDHRAVKKDHSVQLLILGGTATCSSTPLAQESLDVISSRRRRLLPVVKEDKPANPGYIVRDGLLLCPGFPQYGNGSLRPERLGGSMAPRPGESFEA